MLSGMLKLKAQEARYRYLATRTTTSPEYRKEAMAKLLEVREKIHNLSREAEEDKKD